MDLEPMSIYFNADEIFEIAEQIERNGAKFYRQAAKGTEAPQNQELLLNLAQMEDEHLKTFAAMRADTSKQEQVTMIDPVFDPEGEAALYLRAMADGKIFHVNVEPSEFLTGKEAMEEVLQIAIGKEKDSVVFYVGMKEMVPEKFGKSRIGDIIKEEMSHIRLLSEELAKAKKTG
jgi:rubrerythrin